MDSFQVTIDLMSLRNCLAKALNLLCLRFNETHRHFLFLLSIKYEDNSNFHFKLITP